VHALKPFVHSDCGGDGVYHGDVAHLRWTAHCVLGPIVRYHGADHRPWHDGPADNATVPAAEDTIRKYLQMRYRLVPSLIAAGHQVTQHGFPLVARLDMFWPEHSPLSASNMSYLFLNDTLVAPIVDMEANVSTRTVWIPPGQWQDGWNGSIVTGPRLATVTQPYDRIPMWHKRGSFTVMASQPSLRVRWQDWSELTLEIFPGPTSVGGQWLRSSVHKQVHERDSADALTMLEMLTEDNQLTIQVSPGPGQLARGWCLRVHMQPGQLVAAAEVDGEVVALGGDQPTGSDGRRTHTNVLTLIPIGKASRDAEYFPFAGAGKASPFGGGLIAELTIERLATARVVTMSFVQE
jgi:hypothetical protein